MGRPREFDEEKALEAAMQLFWEKGFEATSLTDLTTRMEVQRPSIYSVFGDKKALFEAALRKYTSAHATHVRSILQSKASVQEAFRAFFEQLIAEAYEKSPSWGCLCINAMVELSPHDEKFEVLTREHQMYLAVIFQETIERGLRSGELDPATNARSLAQALILSLIGLTVFLKSRPDRSFAQQAIQQTLQLIQRSPVQL